MIAHNKEAVTLSQWDALLLESLRNLGWSEDELLRRVHAGELPADDSQFQFDYSRLTELAGSHPSDFEQAVRQGYRIKYNTLRGIASWIRLALGQEPQLLLEPGRESVICAFHAEEHARLASVLSYGWVVRKDSSASAEEKTVYLIEPLVRG
jgi:hypothetical protein